MTQGVTSVNVQFASHHLQTAAMYAREVHRIEIEHTGEPYGSFFDEIIRYASSVIIMSLAALEANINEHIDSVIQNSSDPIKTRCRELFREPVLKKYDQLAAILKQPFPKGVVAWENVKLLNDFRNILVHFHPEWSGQSGPHSKFSQIRSRKVKRSQFVVGPVFPHNFLSYSCVKWAVRSAIEFDAYYVGSLGLQSLFAKLINPPINLP